MAGGRPPKGPRIVDRLEASEEAKERLKTILQTITGETSVLQAREKLGVSDTRFYQLRDEVLKAALARMEPMARGRPRKETPERAAELARLREENEALKRELEKERVRAVLAEALPHVVKAPEEKKKDEAGAGGAIRGEEGEAEEAQGGAAPAEEGSGVEMTEAKAEAGVAAIPELGFTEALEAAFAAAADREARASGRPPERLGLEGQRERREGEEAARAFAAQSIRRLLDLGMTLVGAARLLCLPLRTAWEWLMRWTGPVPDLLARGRKPGAGSVAERMDVWETLEWHGPRVGVPTLRAAHPGLSRGVVREIKRDFVKAWKRANRKTIHVLRWYRPGAVWSMDFGNLPNLVAGVFSRFLPVKDLASRALIEVFPTKDMKAETVVALLEFLFDYYGEPLAIKSDNGSGFIDGEVRTLLEKRGVFLLLSPALLPSYNGGAEAGVGSVRGHALYHALATGDACEWTLDDIHAAKSRHNATPRSDGKTPGELFEARTPITPEEREAFRASVERHRRTALHRFDLAWKEKLSRDDLAKIDRYALRRALEELGYLSFRRRAITPAIPYKIRARIP